MFAWAQLPWLLLSGSWDGTIRAWDIRRASGDKADHQLTKQNNGDGDSTLRKLVDEDACIAVMRDHVADVYGISAEESRPFLYVSASRDTTLRQFTLEGVVSSLRTRAVISNSLTGCLGEIEESMSPGCSPSLCGQASKALQAKLHGFRREGRPPAEASRRLFDFFWGPDGVDDLWDVLRWVLAAAANNPDKNATACGGTTSSESDSLSERKQDRHDRHRSCDYEGVGGDHHVRTERSHEEERANSNSHVPIAKTSLREIPKGLMWVEERVLHRKARRASARALGSLLSQSSAFLFQDRRLGKLDRLERAARQYVAAGLCSRSVLEETHDFHGTAVGLHVAQNLAVSWRCYCE